MVAKCSLIYQSSSLSGGRPQGSNIFCRTFLWLRSIHEWLSIAYEKWSQKRIHVMTQNYEGLRKRLVHRRRNACMQKLGMFRKQHHQTQKIRINKLDNQVLRDQVMICVIAFVNSSLQENLQLSQLISVFDFALSYITLMFSAIFWLIPRFASLHAVIPNL